jgi:hypothetical protein
MRVSGPLITLAAVAVLGAGILLVNISKEPDPAPQNKPAAESTTTAAATPAPTPPTAAAPPAFAANADYIGKVPTATGVITLDITVEGDKATAYACDGNTVESWLRGPAVNGTVNLASKDNANRLEGRLDGTNIVGTLSIGEKTWDFTAAAVAEPAGLYVYEEGGVRASWIVDPDGGVTGVLRREDGSTVGAPGLASDGTAVIGGRTVKATRVGG